MAWTLNGIGTTFYGKHKLGDGTYIKTQWFVWGFIPVFPLKSFKILGEVSGGINFNLFGFGSDTSYSMQRVPLYWPQVIKTYLAALGIVATGVFFYLLATWVFFYL